MARKIVLWTEAVAAQHAAQGGWSRRNDESAMVYVSSDPKKPGTDLGKFGVVWAIATVDDSKPPGEQLLFDAMMRGENPGAAFLPVNEAGHVGLQLMNRPQAKDLAAYNAVYPQLDPANLGRESWEIPRGFGEKGETWEVTTDREVLEETGRRVKKRKLMYAGCDNTASVAHPTFMSTGTVSEEVEPIADDKLEQITVKLTFFSREQRAKLIKEGKLYCHFTLSAIGAFGDLNPGVLK